MYDYEIEFSSCNDEISHKSNNNRHTWYFGRSSIITLYAKLLAIFRLQIRVKATLEPFSKLNSRPTLRQLFVLKMVQKIIFQNRTFDRWKNSHPWFACWTKKFYRIWIFKSSKSFVKFLFGFPLKFQKSSYASWKKHNCRYIWFSSKPEID